MTVMAAGASPGIYGRFKPHILMILVQFCNVIVHFMAEASFKHGLKPHVYVTYRNLVAGLVMMPFAYFLERKSRPDLTFSLSVEIGVVSFLGGSLSPVMYFASLRYTSPTYTACMLNAIACLTFVVAVILRLEVVDFRSPRGVSKVVGTLVSLAGVMVITLYRGPIIRSLGHPFIHLSKNSTSHENWIKGPILAVMSCLGWSLNSIMQAYTIKRYPAQAQLSLVTCFNLIGAAKSATLAMIFDYESAPWRIGFNIDLWTIIFSGVVFSSLLIVCQIWCEREKGPIFVTMFDPLNTLFVALGAYFVFDEKLYTGSIVGGVMVIIGFYLLLWGKEGDRKAQDKSTEQSNLAYDQDGEDLKQRTFVSTSNNIKLEKNPSSKQ